MSHNAEAEREEVDNILLRCTLDQLRVIAVKARLDRTFLPSGSAVTPANYAVTMLQLATQPWACGLVKLKQITLQVCRPTEDIEVAPLYRRGDTSFRGMTVAQLSFHLSEWKDVHTKSQNLLMSVPKNLIRRVNELSTDNEIYMIGEIWHDICEGKVREIYLSFQNFKFIRNRSIENLLWFIKSSEYTARCINNLKINDTVSINDLQNSLETFLGILGELMRVADIYIVQIADSFLQE